MAFVDPRTCPPRDLDPPPRRRFKIRPDGPAKTLGLSVGDGVGAAIVEVRADEHWLDPNPAYVFTPGPGVYEPTPPAFAPPVNVGAATWRPSALAGAAQGGCGIVEPRWPAQTARRTGSSWGPWRPSPLCSAESQHVGSASAIVGCQSDFRRQASRVPSPPLPIGEISTASAPFWTGAAIA